MSSKQPDNLAASIATLLALTIVQRGVGFVRQVLFCRWLAPEQLGQWDLALGFLEMAAPVAVLGIPGCYGRYVEHYRHRGHLRGFLAWTGGATALLGTCAVVLVLLRAEWFSSLVFGTPDKAELTQGLALTLALLMAYHFSTVLLTSLRKSRWSSLVEFLHSVTFTGLGLLAAFSGNAGVANLAWAYAGATAVAVVAAWIMLRRMTHEAGDGAESFVASAMWQKMAPFAVWVWATNWLANVFELADRYMLVHCSGLPPEEAIVLVGNFHSARVFPLLLVSISGLLATLLLPYLSHDWEAGRKDAVSKQMNLALKCLGVALLAGSTALLVAGPILFETVLKGKFAAAAAILPATLTCCVWFALARVAQKYLWCCERVPLAVVSWVAGLIVNVAMNAWLLPTLGLYGVALATAAGNLVALVGIFAACQASGMKLDPGTASFALLPFSLLAGPTVAVTIFALVMALSVGSEAFFTVEERRTLKTSVGDLFARWQASTGGAAVRAAEQVSS